MLKIGEQRAQKYIPILVAITVVVLPRASAEYSLFYIIIIYISILYIYYTTL